MDPEVVRRRVWTSLAILAMAALFSMSASRCEDPRVASLSEERTSQRVAVGAPSDAEIRAALLAIEFWSDEKHPPYDEIPEDLRPITLEEAADILNRDKGTESPFGNSRWSRSVITLTVEGLELDDKGRPSHRHRAALERLGAPLVEIDREIAKLVNASSTHATPSAHLELTKLVRAQLPVILSTEIPSLFPLSVSSCTLIGTPLTYAYMKWRDNFGSEKKSPCSSMADAIVVGNTTVDVDREFCALTQLLDAQNWDAPESPAGQCNVYFEKALLVERNFWGNGWVPDNNPPAPGSEWGTQTHPMSLNEIFVTTWQPISKNLDTRMETILNVWTNLDFDQNQNPTKYELHYNLREHRYSRIGNDDRGHITIDEGHTEVLPYTGKPGRYAVEGEKQLQFAGWQGRSLASNTGVTDWNGYYNMLACYSIQSMGKALQEFVCCDVPPPDQCP